MVKCALDILVDNLGFESCTELYEKFMPPIFAGELIYHYTSSSGLQSILKENPEEEDYLVAWEKGTTSEDGCWYCHAERLEEYVPKYKTIEEIMCEFHKFSSNLTFDLSRLYKNGKFKSNIKLSNEQLEQIICLSYDLGRNSNE